MTDQEKMLRLQLEEIRVSDRVTVKDLEELTVPVPGAESSSGFPIVTPAAIESWRRFEQDKPLSQEDLFNLRGIVLGNGLRPAFDIENDSYGVLPSKWNVLNDQRAVIEPLIRGIGRLDLTGHPEFTHAGTAFLCGERRLITNRHVAELFTAGLGEQVQLSFLSGITASVDLKQEVTSSATLIIQVTAPILILNDWDVAVFEVEAMPNNVMPLPLAASEPNNIEDRDAAVIGYPARDVNEDLVQQIAIFRNVFNKKRLLPGLLKGRKPAESFGQKVQALAHDCTTLNGSSGSAVIDVRTGRVVGVHFTSNRAANYAVPTWELADNPQIRKAGVEFVV
jgi:endonuclease G